jgi:hypothetical protein
MPDERPQGLYPIGYDERQEAWFVAVTDGASLPLDRPTLTRLVECYNEIHRGAALTLMERRALVELGQERCALQETVHSLYDSLDAEGAPPPPPQARWWTRIARWMERTRS